MLREDAVIVRFPARRMCVCSGNAVASSVEHDNNGLSMFSLSCSTAQRPEIHLNKIVTE
jgi:hypothetical protein